MFELIRSNKRRSVAAGRRVRHLRRPRRRCHRLPRRQWVHSLHPHRAAHQRSDRLRVVLEGRQDRALGESCPTRAAGRVPAAPQPRGGPVHRRRAAEARHLRHRRSGTERVRHGSQPEPCGDRGHVGAAGTDEPGRARRRRRPRTEPHPQLRHPRVHAGGHDGRSDRADATDMAIPANDVVERWTGARARETTGTTTTRSHWSGSRCC